MSLQEFVEEVRARGILGVPAQRIVELPAQEPTFAEIASPLRESTRRALDAVGVRRFFRHQAQAIDAALAGRDVVLATGTNSGKSLAYQVPALEALAAEPSARVLMLFPTKALAQDQLGKVEAMLPPGVRCATYDGDTPPAQRSAIRRNAQVILTNPDMLHVGVLPNHDLWSRVLKSLRLIVIDEMHVYRGVFGSHVASVLWRLLRLCEWYGSRPQIV
ncbi:MAG: DEAD/DEAH box helicase, partial [Fimbriimonadales bacterium]